LILLAGVFTLSRVKNRIWTEPLRGILWIPTRHI